jgi:hypothetical protein
MSAKSRFMVQFGGGGGGGGGLKQLEVGVTPIISGTVGRLLFEGNGNVLQESNGLVWDIANSRLGIRTTTPECTLDVHSSGTSNARGIQVSHYDDTTSFSPAKIIGRRARGTQATPLVVQSGDALASFNARGRKSSDWSDTVGGFYVSANENWTDAATGTFMSFRGVNNGGTTVSEWMRISQGNIGINQTNPTSLLDIKGEDDIVETKAVRVLNNSDFELFSIRNSGVVDFALWGDPNVNGTKFIGLNNSTIGTHLNIVAYGNANSDGTVTVGINSAFSPTSGSGLHSSINITGTINQTGGANGVTRGIHVDKTITVAFSYRAIETSNNTGYSFYGAGTANAYYGGRIGVRRVTAGATVDIQAEGALSTDIAFRVRNSADSADIIAVQGNNQIVKGASAIIVPNVQSVTSAATVTPVSGNDMVVITAQAEALTLANPTGTWVQGQDFFIRIKDDGIAREINYGINYRAIGVTLPPSTTSGKTLYLGLVYNSTDNKWDVIGVSTEA